MATSKSRKDWIAGVHIYSGRHDPSCPVSKAVVNRLQKIWDAMPPISEKPSPPGLGYRGAFLRAPDQREWLAFNGAVTLTSPAGVESRQDLARKFENALLASAPKGLLPQGFSRPR
jgi:hypothetical protein